eukprot:gene12959-biopygen4982
MSAPRPRHARCPVTPGAEALLRATLIKNSAWPDDAPSARVHFLGGYAAFFGEKRLLGKHRRIPRPVPPSMSGPRGPLDRVQSKTIHLARVTVIVYHAKCGPRAAAARCGIQG